MDELANKKLNNRLKTKSVEHHREAKRQDGDLCAFEQGALNGKAFSD
jgi:hypothetical protein